MPRLPRYLLAAAGVYTVIILLGVADFLLPAASRGLAGDWFFWLSAAVLLLPAALAGVYAFGPPARHGALLRLAIVASVALAGIFTLVFVLPAML